MTNMKEGLSLGDILIGIKHSNGVWIFKIFGADPLMDVVIDIKYSNMLGGLLELLGELQPPYPNSKVTIFEFQAPLEAIETSIAHRIHIMFNNTLIAIEAKLTESGEE